MPTVLSLRCARILTKPRCMLFELFRVYHSFPHTISRFLERYGLEVLSRIQDAQYQNLIGILEYPFCRRQSRSPLGSIMGQLRVLHASGSGQWLLLAQAENLCERYSLWPIVPMLAPANLAAIKGEHRAIVSTGIVAETGSIIGKERAFPSAT